MTKTEFIQKLTEALTDLPGAERIRALEYFEEIIDDRIESGMNEEEAVAAMGSIDNILKETESEVKQAQQTHSRSNAGKSDEPSVEFREPIQSLFVKCSSARLSVQGADLPAGITARISYRIPDDDQCLCSLSDGRLEVIHEKQKELGFSLRKLFSSASNTYIRITLNNPALSDGVIATSSGDLTLNKLVFTDSLDVGTASGNVNATDVAVQDVCKLHTSSGDVSAKNLTCGELLNIHTSSGDVCFNTVRAGKIEIGTASGDIEIRDTECDAFHSGSASGDAAVKNLRSATANLSSTSGDLKLTDAVCSGNIEMNGISGDIEIRNVSCSGEICLSVVSGDIKGKLEPEENFSFHTHSRSGSVRTPRTNGPCRVEINTQSGDIRF